MKLPVKLQELLHQSEAVITSISTLLAQGSAILDCSEIESLTPDALNQLIDLDFVPISINSSIPNHQCPSKLGAPRCSTAASTRSQNVLSWR
jgi:hypothetical protein